MTFYERAISSDGETTQDLAPSPRPLVFGYRVRMKSITDRMLQYRVRRLMDSGYQYTIAAIARRLGVSRSRIYRLCPEVKFRVNARPRMAPPPVSSVLRAFAAHFGSFDELDIDRSIPTKPPTVSSAQV